MPFALFQNENLAEGLPKNGQFQAGLSNFDGSALTVERGITIPFAADPEATWVYYNPVLLWVLDSGIVVHRRLPQVDNTADMLASCDFSDAGIDKLTGRGVNLKSNDQFADVVQRMAHSRYFLHLSGEAMRVGQQVPIPSVRKLSSGQVFIPHDEKPQWAYNKIVGNYSGAILWYAQWSSWYTLASPPSVLVAPTAPNLAQHIDDTAKTPVGFQAPFSQPDDQAQTTQPIQFQAGIIQP